MAAVTKDSVFPRATHNFYVAGAFLTLFAQMLRTLVWTVLAIILYRFGPRVRRFFGEEESSPQ